MSKCILIISTSLRRGGNSEALAAAFAHGAQEAGHRVKTISLADKTIGFCKGCLTCQNTQRCMMEDDASAIVQQMSDSDVIVFATPIYYYEMCGQMKTLLDRSNPLFTSDYAFRDIYLLAAAAEEDKSTIDNTITGLRGWIDCYEEAHLEGVVFGGGVNHIGDMNGSPALEKACQMGKSIQ